MKKLLIGLLALGSSSSFGAEVLYGMNDNGEECSLTIHKIASNGMVIETTETSKTFIPQAIYRQGDQVVLEPTELRKVEINEKMNVHEQIISVSLAEDGTPTSYSVYDRNTVPVIGSLFPKSTNCRL